ncbi:hypothetical protein [Winogradskyella sp. SM1960]|uniref:hypothetical protein n=1 Tax=Winogradskyella sp. SM1960 TaxID=2865955 RepID=UPI001CD6D6C5|nr:hypothetical protein [Winogradskyella sp. SM1960]
MKKKFLLVITFFTGVVFISCNPESIEEPVTPVACCGESGEIPPPPIPPTDTGG